MSGSISGQTQGFTALVTGQAAVMQAAALPTAPLDFTIGSVFRALAEGSAWLGLWLQGLILQVLTLTRASTSNGTDLDSWMADFTLSRIGAVSSTGQVTFGRYTPSVAAAVAPGVTVATGDGSQVFTVIADPSQLAWVASAGQYQLPSGVASAAISVSAVTAGAGGNVAGGTISVLTTPLSGVDYVTNPQPMSGGLAAEADAALRARFANFINTRSLSTSAAIGYAVSSVPGATSYSLTQNYDYSGVYDPGSFYVVVDDGSGAPPASLIAAVSAAVAVTAGAGIRFGVLAPVLLTADVSMTLTTAAGYNHAALVAAVQAAVTGYIDGLPVGAALAINKLAQIAFDAAPGISNISAVSVNGAVGDMGATAQQIIRAGMVAVV